jgi:hypothetical protein
MYRRISVSCTTKASVVLNAVLDSTFSTNLTIMELMGCMLPMFVVILNVDRNLHGLEISSAIN